ncbi:tRNA (guanine(26)-N(2))-dimethyltransferase-like [Condylostylus longicornis]|uniref:tRNA (guanine(26)-N(2))-dimethyltransferase-like n=1 Tax=Condylostylus longicornis TaxID=2530218 RepID=UPI00244DE1B0|nr:tRNA (guanine(26)-N(2))-dimethyltransferase-like [Condylostylus longicornis]
MSASKPNCHLPSVDENGLVEEGKAHIFNGDANDVFYNPVQVFNRDLSVLAIRAFATLRRNEEHVKSAKSDKEPSNTKLKILESFGATGLRSIRYALELDDVIDLVVVGDLDAKAVRLIEANRERNQVDETKLRAVCSDANQLMYMSRYGGINATRAFILPAVGSTDSPAIQVPIDASTQISHFDVIDLDPYGSVGDFLDAAVQSVADGGILCITSTDMPILCGNNPEEFVDLCLSLLNEVNEEGPLSGMTMNSKIRGLLTAISEEGIDVPLYYHLPSLMNRVKVEAIKTSLFKSALLNLGFSATHFHREPQSIKTNAPPSVVFDILRKWAQEHPPKNPEKYEILKKEISTETPICFDPHPDAMSKTPGGVCKWLPNPAPYWGPKARAKSKR